MIASKIICILFFGILSSQPQEHEYTDTARDKRITIRLAKMNSMISKEATASSPDASNLSTYVNRLRDRYNDKKDHGICSIL